MILEPELAPFKELLLSTCGFGFANDRERTLQEALAQRMALGASAEEYLATLRSDPAELERLVELLTVKETYFLREPEHLDLLVDTLVPERRAEHPGPVRILCAGCSTGEEPYSLAMLLQDRTGLEGMILTGVDLDASAIAKARQATYGRHSFRGMDPDFEARHFEDADPLHKRVKAAVRGQVTFAQLNLLSPSYPASLDQQDIILYRNVSIYFPRPVQEGIFRHLAALLKPGGYLLVGATETLFLDLGILSLIERNALYLFRKGPSAKPQDPRRNRRRPVSRTAPAAEPGFRSPKDPLAEALACARSRLDGQALAILDGLLEQDPGHIQALALKASVLLAGERPGEARPVAEAALALDPCCLEPHLILGLIAHHQGDDLAAVKRFREAIYLEATCWFAYYTQAEILFAMGERSRARTGYKAALRLLGTGAYHRSFFPLAFDPADCITLCRHRLALLH